ncbi:MAG TPA: endonuclease NucS [Candidatus Thermoplasmatota archaeon]|nr:endonuclease NucS [Candidatus Thermoplasmatota archaeon]
MTFRLLRDLSPEAATDFLKSELGVKVVAIVARCKIDYQGRAASQLSTGDRFILLKPDGTLLVHTAEKLKPVNWQPPGCQFQAGLDGDLVVVTCSREKPREVVKLTLEEVYAIQSFRLADDEVLELSGTEDEMQELLAKKPELVEPGFKMWRRERDSRRGPMDLYGEDVDGNRVIVETKRRAATVGDVEQIRRYVEKERAARGEGIRVRGILLAPSVSETAKRYLADLGLEWREIPWDRLLKAKETLVAANQATLMQFGDAAPAAKSIKPKRAKAAKAPKAAPATEGTP